MVAKLIGISGSMFSGKTEELIRLITRAKLAGKKIQVFKHIIDNRWGEKILAHSGVEHEAKSLKFAKDIWQYLNMETQLIAIDEVQFFEPEMLEIITRLIEKDIEVIFAGLPLDFRGEPFGIMPILLAMADKIIQLTAICTHLENGKICGREATRTQRLIDGKPAKYNDPLILIGSEESYAARCSSHHIVSEKHTEQFYQI